MQLVVKRLSGDSVTEPQAAFGVKVPAKVLSRGPVAELSSGGPAPCTVHWPDPVPRLLLFPQVKFFHLGP